MNRPASSETWASETFCSNVDNNSSKSADACAPSTVSPSGLVRSRLRRNEFIARRHELIGVELLSFERACDSTILFEHHDRRFPILLRHPSERLASGVGRDPGRERQLRLPSRDRRHRRFGEFLDDDSEFVGMRTPVKEASEARGDKGPDDLGIVLDEIGMNDDAVAHSGDAAIGIPEDSSLLVTANLDARHIALGITGDRGDLAGDQSRRAAGGIDIGEPNLASIKAAALHEGGPLHKLSSPSWAGNGLAL